MYMIVHTLGGRGEGERENVGGRGEGGGVKGRDVVWERS